jgi:peptidase M48-like protein
MRTLKSLLLVLAIGIVPLAARAQQPATTLDQVIARVIAQESAQMQNMKKYSPLVETYIQKDRPDKELGTVPDGDQYFLGRAELAKGVQLEPLTNNGGKHRVGALGSFFTMSMQFLPGGFLQMIYIDESGLNRANYNFDYVRREFLGEVRCLVFDVTPTPKSGKGRFSGRIWVEDQGYHIVRFNGAFVGSSRTSYYFHFDSWRVNVGADQWLPAFIYSEESDVHYALSKRLMFKAQTRLWGYNLGHSQQEEELSKILVEGPTPIKDQTTTANDLTPLQAQRSWDLQAEDNVADRMERLGLMAPAGEVDKVLATVVNNLEVTNNLDIEPEIRCRVLMTSTLESFTIGHTIVLSRGLIDVLPDEASLAVILAHELGHVVLGHRIDTQYAFFDRLLFDEKDAFHHFGFARSPEEEAAANQKGLELLTKSPYKDQLGTPELFLTVLQTRSKEIPNLISPHLGDRISINLPVSAAPTTAKPGTTVIAALPLGGRIKLNPWTNGLEMLKSKPVGQIAEREKMPFEVTPFVLYLTRYDSNTGNASQNPSAVSADSKQGADATDQDANRK